MATAAAFVEERRLFAATVADLGPDAPTLCGPWSGEDLAAHVVSLERFAGMPTFLGRRLLLAGLPVGGVGRRTADLAIRANRRKGFDWLLARLRREPPWSLRRPSVLVMSLLEAWVHHEDLRRANGADRRPVEPDLVPCVEWALRFRRKKLAGVTLAVATDGRRLTAGAGPTRIELTGPPGEVLLWLAGRHRVAAVEVAGDPGVIARLADTGI